MQTHVAAIDIGTNSVLMLLSRATGEGRFVTVRDRAEVTRLGQGLDRSGILAPEAIERTLAVLRVFTAEARELGASVVAVGTSALRDAANASDLLEPARIVLGAEVRVISGRREAELGYRGALLGLQLDGTEVTVVDVGGGSTEITRGGPDRLEEAWSIQLGAVRLLERAGLPAPATAEQLAAVKSQVRAELGSSPAMVRGSLVAVGGTATTAAAVLYGVDPYRPESIHGREIGRGDLDDLLGRLSAMTIEGRNGLKGLQKGRADVIVPGMVILSELSKRAGSASLKVSTGGIRVALTMDAFRGSD